MWRAVATIIAAFARVLTCRGVRAAECLPELLSSTAIPTYSAKPASESKRVTVPILPANSAALVSPKPGIDNSVCASADSSAAPLIWRSNKHNNKQGSGLLLLHLMFMLFLMFLRNIIIKNLTTACSPLKTTSKSSDKTAAIDGNISVPQSMVCRVQIETGSGLTCSNR